MLSKLSVQEPVFVGSGTEVQPGTPGNGTTFELISGE